MAELKGHFGYNQEVLAEITRERITCVRDNWFHMQPFYHGEDLHNKEP